MNIGRDHKIKQKKIFQDLSIKDFHSFVGFNPETNDNFP